MNRRNLMILYTILLGTGVLSANLKSLMSLAVLAVNVLALLSNKKNTGIVLLSSFLLGGEFFPIINVFISVVLSGSRMIFRKPRKNHLLFFGFLIAASLINALLNMTVINVIFSVVYWTVLYTVMLFSIEKIEVNDLLYSIRGFIIIEFLANVLIGLSRGTYVPGDAFTGTLNNAHWLGNWILVNLFTFLVAQRNIQGKKWSRICKENLFIIIIGVTTLYLAEAKTLVGAMVIGIFLYLLFEYLGKQKKSFLYCFICFYIGLFLFTNLFEWDAIKNLIISLSPDYSIYLYKEGWNGKALYIVGTFTEQMQWLHLFTGYGMGQYGSRVANMFAYDVMWRGDNAVNRLIAAFFEPSYLQNYAQYIKYYTTEFVAGIRWRSAILSYPFSSIIALIGETGVIGVLGFAKVIQYYVKDSACRFLAFYFMVACLFDIYFDNFPCVALIIVVLANTRVAVKEKTESMK